MKHKSIPLCAILLLVLGIADTKAQSMNVTQNNRSQTAFILSYVRKITFSQGNVLVQKSDNTISGYQLNGLSNITFWATNTDLIQKKSVEQKSILTYPNPIIDILHIDLPVDYANSYNISILSLDGKSILNHDIKNTDKISMNLSHLLPGVYICRYSNNTTIKTIKIIKQ